jgi:hypothetical protein
MLASLMATEGAALKQRLRSDLEEAVKGARAAVAEQKEEFDSVAKGTVQLVQGQKDELREARAALKRTKAALQVQSNTSCCCSPSSYTHHFTTGEAALRFQIAGGGGGSAG